MWMHEHEQTGWTVNRSRVSSLARKAIVKARLATGRQYPADEVLRYWSQWVAAFWWSSTMAP